jgi:hypothetical protein
VLTAEALKYEYGEGTNRVLYRTVDVGPACYVQITACAPPATLRGFP